MRNTDKTSGPTNFSDPEGSLNPLNASPGSELPQDITAKSRSTTPEQEIAYREVLASLRVGPAGESHDQDVTDADLRHALVALCFDVVRYHARPNERLRRYLPLRVRRWRSRVSRSEP